MEKAYNPKEHEAVILKQWENSGFANPDNLPGERSEPYAVMMPPPNVTGVLHLGHALENTLMDIEVRFQRMRGKRTLLVPGTDHAAIATQARVEKNLVAEGIAKPREHFGREALLEKIRSFAEESKATILSQIRQLGTSCDWSRLAYTFDEERSRIVTEVFKRMYDDGLIYRGTRLINWSTGTQSVLSDDELEWEDRSEPFYYIRCGEFVIATVRPETKCADSPVVVHPTASYVRVRYTSPDGKTETLILSQAIFEDTEQRNKVLNRLDLAGTFEILETMTGAELAGQEFDYPTYAGTRHFTVLADEVIDPEKGTGAMTISSAHSQDDYDLAKRRKLDDTFITKIDMTGHMTAVAGPAEGLSVQEARATAARLMKEQGLLVGVDEQYVHSVPLCYRSGVVVEPMISPQWFVDVNKEVPGRGKSLKDMMREAVTTGLNHDAERRVRITPERFSNIYLHWIDNLHDWCISRQLWWGHRIPVWYRGDEVYCGITAPEGEGWTQDEDTLDTWFSSGMWTFSTLGWPNSPDYAAYHPSAWMQMGHEILFLWMARMILFSAYVVDDIPFRDVYIHGILRDKDGRKFSKSLGNGIDPLDVMEQYGTDALRLSLIKGIAPGNDARFFEAKVEDARNFVNKLWNVSRYVLMQESSTGDNGDGTSLPDRWILSRLSHVVATVTEQLEAYQFSQASETLYDFVWHEFADWYVEMSKVDGVGSASRVVLETVLKLLHPIAPFVTEQIAHEIHLRDMNDNILMVTPWPVADSKAHDVATEKQMADIQKLIMQIRNWRAEEKIDPARLLNADNEIFPDRDIIDAIISRMARLEFVWPSNVERYTTITSGPLEIKICLDGIKDIEKERADLQQKINQKMQYITRLKKQLANKNYIEHAPPNVVEDTRQRLAKEKTEIALLQQALEQLD